jgi:dienelactone hydrolase
MMKEHPVSYEYDGRAYEGMLVYDDSVTEKRPAIFMQPDWLGVCSHTIGMAAEAAESDYVILLADMFGKDYGGEGKTHDELGKVARSNRSDIDFILGCGAAADAALTAEADKLGLIDNTRRGAVGYCMGGGYLTEQIRNGGDFRASVFIHVTLPMTVAPNRPSNIKGRVLTIHGTDDSVTPVPQVDSFQAELTANGVDWQTMMFGGAPHGFCVHGAADVLQRYDDKLCKQTYRLMRDFFNETF